MKITNQNQIMALTVSAVLLGFTSAAMASPATIKLLQNTSSVNGYSDSAGGGEFAASVTSTATPADTNASTFVPTDTKIAPADSGTTIDIAAYSALASAQTGGVAGNSVLNSSLSTFQTFCLESNVTFNPATTYNFVLSQEAETAGKTLTMGVAYLYSQFAIGKLTNYDYTLGSGRTASALGLQYVIWLLGGQSVVGQPGNLLTLKEVETAGGSVFLQDLVAKGLATDLGQVGTGVNAYENYNLTAAEAVSNGADDVAAMVLWTGSDTSPTYAQDQLVLTGNPAPAPPVPDGGATIALLGMAVGGLAFFKRKFA